MVMSRRFVPTLLHSISKKDEVFIHLRHGTLCTRMVSLVDESFKATSGGLYHRLRRRER
jgi:hypothetical protein